jgi:hypothetical protein
MTAFAQPFLSKLVSFYLIQRVLLMQTRCIFYILQSADKLVL